MRVIVGEKRDKLSWQNTGPTTGGLGGVCSSGDGDGLIHAHCDRGWRLQDKLISAPKGIPPEFGFLEITNYCGSWEITVHVTFPGPKYFNSSASTSLARFYRKPRLSVHRWSYSQLPRNKVLFPPIWMCRVDAASLPRTWQGLSDGFILIWKTFILRTFIECLL